MKKIIIGLKDNLIGIVEISQAQNEAIAIRGFHENMQNPENPVTKNPKDFELWVLGTLDVETGKIESEPKLLIKATQCMPIKDEEQK